MKRFLPYWAFVAVALASLATAIYAYRAGENATRFKFAAAADDAMGRIKSRIDLDLSLLVATRAMLEAKHDILSPTEFEHYFDALSVDRNFLGLRGVGYLSLWRTSEGPAPAAALETAPPPAVFPATDQPLRAAVTLFQPRDPVNDKALGYDMYTDPIRRQAIDAAIASGRMQATARVILGQATGAAEQRPGLLVYAAIKPQRPDQPSPGLAYIAFRTNDLFEAALGQAPVLPVAVSVTDETDPRADNQLYVSPDEPSGLKLGITRHIDVAGRQWRLDFAPTIAFDAPNSALLPWLLGLAGLSLALAVAGLARYQQRAYDAKSRLHDASEKNLLERELILQEMKHRIKNSIARVLAIARQTAAHSQDLRHFLDSFSARLQAIRA